MDGEPLSIPFCRRMRGRKRLVAAAVATSDRTRRPYGYCIDGHDGYRRKNESSESSQSRMRRHMIGSAMLIQPSRVRHAWENHAADCSAIKFSRAYQMSQRKAAACANCFDGL